jgi:acetyl esterase
MQELIKRPFRPQIAITGKPGVLLFIHGGVWIAGDFANHKRLLRDLVVGSGQVGVFVEYTPLPEVMEAAGADALHPVLFQGAAQDSPSCC